MNFVLTVAGCAFKVGFYNYAFAKALKKKNRQRCDKK